jgi:hypothetical protein
LLLSLQSIPPKCDDQLSWASDGVVSFGCVARNFDSCLASVVRVLLHFTVPRDR